jgi:protein-tyrosine phosphatase
MLNHRRLIDIHAHVLPGVDDGARDEQAALEMLRAAADDGIGTLVATPHSHWADGYDIPAAVARLSELASAHDIDIEILPGSEVRIAADLIEQHEHGKLRTLNDTQHLLLELYFAHEWRIEVVERVISRLQEAGVRPILAHPERYPFVVIEPKVIERFVALGVPIQINALSLSGYHSEASRRTALALLEAGLVHIIASDAHSARWRPPQLRQALDEIATLHGQDYVTRLLDNAEAVVTGRDIVGNRD